MEIAAHRKDVLEFGSCLRFWRQTRGLSQLDLALEAEVSSRHVSFMETGRSNPSQEMIMRLCEALDMPLRERNRMLETAGFAAAYSNTPLDDDGQKQVRRALDIILNKQEPYPAIVMNRCYDVLMINNAGAQMFQILGKPLDNDGIPANILRMSLHPDGLRNVVRNWEKMAKHLIQRVHRQIGNHGMDDPLKKLLEETLSYPGIPEDWRIPDPAGDALPVMPVEIIMGGQVLNWISTVAGFGTPCDVTAEEVVIECMFPADEATEHLISSMANQHAI